MTRRAGRALLPLLGILAFAGLAGADMAAAADARAPVPVSVTARPIARFAPGTATRYGNLDFRGGLVLTSSFRAFGGLSGLALDAKGERFLAVSDKGWWFSGRIEAEDDRPLALDKVVAAPMRDRDGRTLATQGRGDVEALTRTADGYAVGIERAQEIWSFAGPDPLTARGRRLPGSEALQALASNQGPEALLAIPLGTPARPSLVVIGERSPASDDVLPGYIFAPEPAGTFTLTRSSEFNATDMALAPDGYVYLLERRFVWYSGVALRIRRFPLAEIRPGATIAGEVMIEIGNNAEIDNMEALAIHRNAAGETILTLMSDDNFSTLQRTLLLRFAVIEDQRAAAVAAPDQGFSQPMKAP
ncbi:esterase-like activity of phytase family protein [Bosea sp. 117]|uniref:esterase-like activity of phytase family protein n=1 Tax=Bosea sp. 117 TaxID=1125973 RepID=UPI0009DEC929|nr:esterase-like activity of phytase family protein [Bosea sp. 117]